MNLPTMSKGRTMHEAMEAGDYFVAEWRDDDGRPHSADYPGCTSIQEVAWYCWLQGRVPACTATVTYRRILEGSTIGCRLLSEPIAEFVRN